MKWSNIVDFNKITILDSYENEIQLLNTLINETEDNIDNRLISIVGDNKKVLDVLILLLAIRSKKLKDIYIDSPYSKGEKYFKLYNDDFNELIYFFKETGLRDFFLNGVISNINDYLKGIIIGLDSNSRKNRNGKIMEEECEYIIKEFCNLNNFTYYKQKKISDIKKDTLINKKFNFLIKKGNLLIVIEVNNFNTTGSKIKSISEEYIRLNKSLKEENIIFLWITNGNGWLKNKKQVEMNLLNIEHFITFKMLKNEYLNTFINKKG